MLNAFAVRLPFVMLAIFFLIRRKSDLDVFGRIVYSCIVAEMLLVPLQQISSSAFRIALYYGIFKIAAYPSLCKRIPTSKWLIYVVYISYLCLYFYLQTIVGGANEIYPFLVASDSIY